MEEPSRLLTTRFETVAPSGKPKAKFHNSIIELPIQIETWIPDKKKKNGDPTNEIRLRKNGRGWWVCLWEGSV